MVIKVLNADYIWASTLRGAANHFGVSIKFEGELSRFNNTSVDGEDKVIDLNEVDEEELTNTFYDRIKGENITRLPVPRIRLAGILLSNFLEVDYQEKEYIDTPTSKEKSTYIAIVEERLLDYFTPVFESLNWEKDIHYKVLNEEDFIEECFKVPKYVFGEAGSPAQYIIRGTYKGIDNFRSTSIFFAYRGPNSPKKDLLWWGMCVFLMENIPPLDRGDIVNVVLNREKYNFDYVNFRKLIANK